MARRLLGESAPERLEIQLISGDDAGMWVEAQSSVIEYRGSKAVLTIARDVSYRKSLEVSLSRSRRQAQYTLAISGRGRREDTRLLDLALTAHIVNIALGATHVFTEVTSSLLVATHVLFASLVWVGLVAAAAGPRHLARM